MARVATEKMRIDVWSDVVCPFCWVGRHRLEAAVRQLGLEDQVDIVHRAYELNPQMGAPQPVHEYLAQRYGTDQAQAREMTRNVERMGAEQGLAFDFDRAIAARTFDAHRLIALARDHGVERAVAEALMQAHFREGADLSDHATLRQTATGAGLAAEDVDRVLATDAYADRVRADVQQAQTFGVRGVPFFVFDQRLAVSGAQPVELFVQALKQATAPPAREGATAD